jgi:hypothetical protein
VRDRSIIQLLKRMVPCLNARNAVSIPQALGRIPGSPRRDLRLKSASFEGRRRHQWALYSDLSDELSTSFPQHIHSLESENPGGSIMAYCHEFTGSQIPQLELKENPPACHPAEQTSGRCL